MKNKKSKNQQFAVIGLGRFGSTVAKTLFEKGEEVLAVDIKEEVITEAHEYTTHAVVADVTDASPDKYLEHALSVGNYIDKFLESNR